MSSTNAYNPDVIYQQPTEPIKPVKPSVWRRFFTVSKILVGSIDKSIENIKQVSDENNEIYVIDNNRKEERTQWEIMDDAFFDINHTMKNTQYKIDRYKYLQAREQYKFDKRNYKLQQRLLKKQRIKTIPSDNESMVTCSEMLERNIISIDIDITKNSDVATEEGTTTDIGFLRENFEKVMEEDEEYPTEENSIRQEINDLTMIRAKNSTEMKLNEQGEIVIKLN